MSTTTKRTPTAKVATVYGTATHFEDERGTLCGARAAIVLDDDDLEFASCARCMAAAGLEPFVFERDDRDLIVHLTL